jgi:exodeoxyribonuclease-3
LLKVAIFNINNINKRLDNLLASLVKAEPDVGLVDGGVDRWARGQEDASDHAPTWIMLDL